MRNSIQLTIIAAGLFIASCGTEADNASSILAEKKASLEKLKSQQTTTMADIAKLEAEIVKLDPASAKSEKPKLVSVTPLVLQNFSHFIDLQGKVTSDDIYYATPRNGVGGQVKSIYVKQGDIIKKGQLLLKLDDAVFAKSVKQLETQLAFAKDVYQRRKNLWDQQIGTEIELKSAANNVNQLEDQIATTKEQWSQTSVFSEVSGVAESINVRVGEFFTGFMGQTPQIAIVNTNTLKVTVQIPESYIERVKRGGSIKITLPDVGKTFNATISLIGNIIDPNSRSFYAEAKLPADNALKPNQVALVKILDYSVSNAVTIPVNTLQSDEKGKFVMVSSMENGKSVARKKPVSIGELYGEGLEIKSGLQAGDLLITDGYQNLYEGQLLSY